MAKASRARARQCRTQQERIWLNQKDMIEVVACLDYCLKHKKNFERIVIGHLKATRGKDATIQDIYSGLRREWNWYGRNDSRTVRDLLVEGSACLVRYTQIDRENIRRAISRLEQQSRCKTRTADLPASILVKAARTGGPARSLRRRLPSVPSSVSTLSVHSTPEFEGIDEALLGDGKAKAVDDEVERAPSTEAVAVRTQDGTTNSDDGQTTAARWSQTSTHVATQTLSPPSESEALAFRLQQELERSQKEIAGLESQIVTLSNRLFAARRECVDMQKNRSIARMTDQDASVLIQNLRYDVSRLTDHLARRSQQEHDLALASKDALGLSDTRIREEFGLVRAEISDACSSVAPIRPMLIAAEYQTEQGTADVESWSQTLAKCSVHELVSSALRSRLPEDVVLRSLAAVGICSLVFEPHFPDFMTTESPLLDQYRKQIFISAGPEKLYHFDLVAHKLLMEEDHFKSKILPDKAKKLAAKLYYSLRPLMAAHDQSTLGFCPTDLFLDTLLCSLELKSKLLLSGKTFKLVYFYPGDTFDPEKMMQDGDTSEHLMQMKGGRKKGLSIKGGTGPSKEVKLCIFPALYMEPNGPRGFGLGLGTVANLDRWLVGYDNIHAGSSAGDLQELVLVVKAVVLV